MKLHLPKLHIVRLRKIFLTVIIIAVIFSLGFYLGERNYSISIKNFKVQISRSLPVDHEDVDFSLFWKVWDILENSYLDSSKVKSSEMVYGAIQGMVAAIGDPYTVFLPPTQNKVVQEDLQGNFGGIGIQIGFKGKQLAVMAPLPGTPAEEAGIKAGDFIIGIKDEKKGIDMGTSGISSAEAVQVIRGDVGTKVILTLLRDGNSDPIVVEIIRKDIVVPSVIVSYVGEEGSIAHVKLLKFAGETNGEWEKAVSGILKKSPKGIILDLRNNPGGYLQGAVDIAGEFLNGDTLVTYEESSTGKQNEFRTDKLPRLQRFPLVLLVNGGSASASEILAGALSEQAKIKVVGETTFGKGTIQEPKQLENGAGLHITIAKWLTPKGNWVNEKGLKPDVIVEDNLETTDDEQLSKALEVISQ